jgi:hypothetical protein
VFVFFVAEFCFLQSQKSFLQLLQISVGVFSGMGALVAAVCRVVLRQATLFMKDLGSCLALKDSTSFLEELLDVFLLLLREGLTDAELLLSLFQSLRSVICRFSEALFVFSGTSQFCGDFVFELLRYANVANGRVRSAATALLYLLMKQNFALKGNFTRMKLQATIAVSRFSGNVKMAQTRLLSDSLGAVAQRALSDFGETMFASQVKLLATTLYRVMEDSAKIHQFKSDQERMCDYMYSISLNYARDSPDLRLTWLNNLAAFHLGAKNYEEHAQCKLMQAALVSLHLHQSDPSLAAVCGVPTGSAAFASVCPNARAQPPVPEHAPEITEEGLFESRDFSVAGLERLIKESLASLQSGHRYELAIQVYDLLITMYQHKLRTRNWSFCFCFFFFSRIMKRYDLMSAAFAEVAQLSRQVMDAEAVGSRSFSAFYRVSFFGDRWGSDLDGKSFIYKADEFSHIAEVTEVLEKQFRASFLQVERVGNKEIRRADLLPDMCYWQIGTVKEYFEENEVYDKLKQPKQKNTLKRVTDLLSEPKVGKRGSLLNLDVDMSQVVGGAASKVGAPEVWSEEKNKPVISWDQRVSKWERKFNVSRFIMVQPFTKNAGKKEQSEGNPEDQWTRKTIFTTEHAFPCVNTRSLVVSTVVSELTPLETATEQIVEQTNNFVAETQRSPPVPNQLQRVIQGAVLTQVNVGVVHTARVLLSDTQQQHPAHLIEKLIAALKEFLLSAEAAIALNKLLIGHEQNELQEAFDKGLMEMKAQLENIFQRKK